MSFGTPTEVAYVGLLFALFVLPRILQRFRVPAAITSLALGAVAGPGLGLFRDDATIELLSTLGIVALFLFAGLDVNLEALRAEARILGEHLAIRLLSLTAVAIVLPQLIDIDLRESMLVSLALLTPSAGFILDSLAGLGLSAETAFWVRVKVIASELVALIAMFAVLQSSTALGFVLSTAVLVVMVVLLPVVFRAFARFIVPYAPKTEFAFLLMISLLCALVTKKLGVYYLVGAFVVGMVAQRFREQLPAMASERMLHAIEAFASIFVPFYFFHAGHELRREDFSLAAVAFALVFLLLMVPMRLGMVVLHRQLRLPESFRESVHVGVPMLPTLVFTLVIAEILRDRYDAPSALFGGLIIYALVNTTIPSFAFRTPPPDFQALEVLPLSEEEERIALLSERPDREGELRGERESQRP